MRYQRSIRSECRGSKTQHPDIETEFVDSFGNTFPRGYQIEQKENSNRVRNLFLEIREHPKNKRNPRGKKWQGKKNACNGAEARENTTSGEDNG